MGAFAYEQCVAGVLFFNWESWTAWTASCCISLFTYHGNSTFYMYRCEYPSNFSTREDTVTVRTLISWKGWWDWRKYLTVGLEGFFDSVHYMDQKPGPLLRLNRMRFSSPSCPSWLHSYFFAPITYSHLQSLRRQIIPNISRPLRL